MPFGFLTLVLMIVGSITIVGLILYIFAEYDRPSGKSMIIWSSITILLAVWIILFSSCDLEETSVKMIEVKYIDVGNKDKIAVVNYFKNNRLHTINLNEKFKKQIPEGSIVRITEYKSGPYYGLYHINTDEKIEVLEKQ